MKKKKGIKWYGSTVYIGIAVTISCAAQNSSFKNHPREILRYENHLCKIALVHMLHKTALNKQNTYRCSVGSKRGRVPPPPPPPLKKITVWRETLEGRKFGESSKMSLLAK